MVRNPAPRKLVHGTASMQQGTAAGNADGIHGIFTRKSPVRLGVWCKWHPNFWTCTMSDFPERICRGWRSMYHPPTHSRCDRDTLHSPSFGSCSYPHIPDCTIPKFSHWGTKIGHTGGGEMSRSPNCAFCNGNAVKMRRNFKSIHNLTWDVCSASAMQSSIWIWIWIWIWIGTHTHTQIPMESGGKGTETKGGKPTNDFWEAGKQFVKHRSKWADKWANKAGGYCTEGPCMTAGEGTRPAKGWQWIPGLLAKNVNGSSPNFWTMFSHESFPETE